MSRSNSDHPPEHKQYSLGEYHLRNGLFFLITLGYTGLLPRAPGTWGTLVSVLVFWYIMGYFPAVSIIAWGAIAFFVSILAIGLVEWHERLSGVHDAPSTVIDECVGVLTAIVIAWAVDPSWIVFPACFALFRFYDIIKPGPIGWIDREVPGGYGTVLDDILAGACTGITYIIFYFLSSSVWMLFS